MASKSSAFNPFMALFGTEDFFLDRDIDKIRQGKRECIYIDADDGLTDTQLVEMCESYSEVPRAIVVDNAQKMKGDKALTTFVEEHNLQDTSLFLVGVVRGDKLPSVWSAVASRGKGIERKMFKPWEDKKYLDFLRKEATRLRVGLGKGVAEMLFQNVGKDLYRLSNELRKLAIYVGQANTIQKEHIVMVTTASPDADPFRVAEAVVAKEPHKAMRLFTILYQNSGDNVLVPVVGALMKQVERTAVIRSLQDKGVGDEDAAVLVGMKPWPYKNVAAPTARKHNLKSLIGHMGKLCQLDAYVKGPSQSKRTKVEMAMLTIAQ